MFILDNRPENDLAPTEFVERFLIKWTNYSYLHLSWETKADLLTEVGTHTKAQVSRFLKKSNDGLLLSSAERGDGKYIPPEYIFVQRVLDVDDASGAFDQYLIDDVTAPLPPAVQPSASICTDASSELFNEEAARGRQILIKWCGVSYAESITSYEYERDLILAGVEYMPQLELYYKRSRKPSPVAFHEIAAKSVRVQVEEILLLKRGFSSDENGKLHPPEKGKRNKNVEMNNKALKASLMSKTWKNGGSLRDYQAEGIAWLYRSSLPLLPECNAAAAHSNNGAEKNSRGLMLADEMGLGKTLQTVAFLECLKNRRFTSKPFLVVVPLSTVAHWYREFESWTDLNVVTYQGSKFERDMIRKVRFLIQK